MACAQLLAMCLLPAKPGAAPRGEPLPIFHDIFRRADKNDDGKLSFEEFKNYFADGILSSEELWELFSGIDRRHSDNVDTEKLCDYFSAYLGEYRNVLSALETLNSAVLAAMDKTKLGTICLQQLRTSAARGLLSPAPSGHLFRSCRRSHVHTSPLYKMKTKQSMRCFVSRRKACLTGAGLGALRQR